MNSITKVHPAAANNKAQNQIADACVLGQAVEYTDQLDNKLLLPIPRNANRQTIGCSCTNLPFTGVDIWNAYEFSWLNEHNLPIHKALSIHIPAESKMLLESKAFKLYLFSFANTVFKTEHQVITQLIRDLSAAADTKVTVTLRDFTNLNYFAILPSFNAISLDKLDVICQDYEVNPDLLSYNPTQIVEENLCSCLFKSNCLVTGKPDWGSIRIYYQGGKISHANLLKYLVSFREHQGFHEHCIERVFIDILNNCKPNKLLVEGRYTRRGGLDINPIRANYHFLADYNRLYRQ